MKKVSMVIILVIACSAFYLLWQRSNVPARPLAQPQPTSSSASVPSAQATIQPPVPPTPPAPPAVAVPAMPPPSPIIPPRPPQPSTPPNEEEPAKLEADSIALNIRHFGQRFGGNPVGNNREIVKAMTGDNPGRARYLSGDLLRLNESGELIDQWGTPYFFHQESSTSMEVRSAGPDKTLYTSDDIISR